MAEKFIPQLAGYYLNVVSVNDSFPSSIIKHEFPFSNRNKLENIGQNTRSFNVECVFMANPPITKGWENGFAAFPTYESYFNFKATLEQTRKVVTFTHPTLGEMDGMIENFSCVNDETKEFATVSFSFLQEVSSDESKFVLYIAPEQAKQFRAAHDSVVADVSALQKLASSLRAFTAAMSIFKGKLDAYLNHIVSHVTSIKNTVTYATDLPSEVVGSINSAIDRIVTSFDTIRNSPASFINNCILGVRDLASIFEGDQRNQVLIMGTSRVAYEAGLAYQDDDARRQAISRKEKKPSFDASGNYVGGEQVPDAMTQQELGQTLYDIKELIYEVLLIDRKNQALRNQAKTLQEYLNTIKLSRDSMETQAISLQTLHTVAMANGSSYQTAERILSMNPQIKNPTFAEGNLKVIIPKNG